MPIDVSHAGLALSTGEEGPTTPELKNAQKTRIFSKLLQTRLSLFIIYHRQELIPLGKPLSFPFCVLLKYKRNPHECSEQKRIQGVKIAQERVCPRAVIIEMQTTVWYIKYDTYSDAKREGKIFKRKKLEKNKKKGANCFLGNSSRLSPS